MTDCHQRELDAAKERYRTGYDAIPWTVDHLKQAMDAMDQFRAREDVRKSGTYFAILGIRECPQCGQKVEYVEGPPESIRICRHVADQLRAMPEVRAAAPTLPGAMGCLAGGIGGFNVEIVRRPEIL